MQFCKLQKQRSPFTISDELFLAFVYSSKAHAEVKSVDPTEALIMAGVKDYVSHTDVTGSNLWGVMKRDEELFASSKVCALYLL